MIHMYRKRMQMQCKCIKRGLDITHTPSIVSRYARNTPTTYDDAKVRKKKQTDKILFVY